MQEAFQNALYKDAAKQSVTTFFEYILCCGVFGVLGASFLLIVRSFKAANQYEIIKKTRESNIIEKTSDKLSDEDIKLIKKYNKIIKSSSSATKDNGRKLKRMTIVLIVLILVLFILLTSFCYYPWRLWEKFELDITQIAPYTDIHTTQKLKSDWVSMTTKNDYISIYNQINNIKKENGLIIN